jgi:hypothetical protein
MHTRKDHLPWRSAAVLTAATARWDARKRNVWGLAATIWPAAVPQAMAYDVNEELSIGGVLAGAYEYEFLSSGFDNGGGEALPFQLELSFRPTPLNEVFFKLGFAAGNALSDKTPFTLAPWAADLEDDVKNINDRNRDYLLTVWYKHTFPIAEGNSVAATGGLIDATDYLDENAYSNDEYIQFMNEALVNGPNAFLPSYDIGGALEWDVGKFSVKGVVMNVGKEEQAGEDATTGENYWFFGGQLGYQTENAWGEGNYRIFIDGTNDEFLNPSGTSVENLASLILSLDQEFGDTFGGWLRLGWQDDKASVTYDALYSGGVNIQGNPWGRSGDNIGIGYGYLNGGNEEVKSTQVFESYYRFVLNEYVALTGDLQYMDDSLEGVGGPRGFILGGRVAVEF